MPSLMRAPAQTKHYVSLDDAAEHLDVSVRTLRRFIASGDLTGYRAGKKIIRVDLNEVDAMLRPIPTAEPTEPPGGSAAKSSPLATQTGGRSQQDFHAVGGHDDA